MAQMISAENNFRTDEGVFIIIIVHRLNAIIISAIIIIVIM